MEISTFCVFKFLSFACFVEKIGVCLESKTEFYKSHFLLATSKKFHSSILKRKPVSAYVFIVEHIFDHFFFTGCTANGVRNWGHFCCPCILRGFFWEADGQSGVGHEFVSSFMVHSVSVSVLTSIGPSGRSLLGTSVATRSFTRSIPSYGWDGGATSSGWLLKWTLFRLEKSFIIIKQMAFPIKGKLFPDFCHEGNSKAPFSSRWGIEW